MTYYVNSLVGVCVRACVMTETWRCLFSFYSIGSTKDFAVGFGQHLAVLILVQTTQFQQLRLIKKSGGVMKPKSDNKVKKKEEI